MGAGIKEKRLTQRAPDVWDASRAAREASSIFLVSSRFASCSQTESTPAHCPLDANRWAAGIGIVF